MHLSEVPVGRLGTPDEVAETVLWMINTAYGELHQAAIANHQLTLPSDQQSHCRGWRNGSAALNRSYRHCSHVGGNSASFGYEYKHYVHQILISIVSVFPARHVPRGRNHAKVLVAKSGYTAFAMHCPSPTPKGECSDRPRKSSPNLPRARSALPYRTIQDSGRHFDAAFRSRRPGPRAC